MSRKKILLVDDHAMFRAGIRALLESEDGLEVVGEASTGEEGVDQVRKLKPDVVVMDLSMPGSSGLEATRRIRRQWPDRPIRIVAMTANAMAGDREACLAAGMDDYISKPIRPAELSAALARVPVAAASTNGKRPRATRTRKAKSRAAS